MKDDIYKNLFEWGWYNRGWRSLIPLIYVERKRNFTYTKYNIALWWLCWRFYWVLYFPKKVYYDAH